MIPTLCVHGRYSVRVVWAGGAQVVGGLAVCIAVGMLAGVWWAVLLAGLMLLTVGVIAEAAQSPAPAQADPHPDPRPSPLVPPGRR